MFKYDIGFIGYGNMAGAIAGRLVENSKLKLAAADINFENKTLPSGIVKLNNIEIAKYCRTVFLSVKPINAAQVLNEINGYLQKETLIISIMAGVKISSIQTYASNAYAVARVMPNLAAKTGECMSGICFSDCVSEGQKRTVFDIFESVGRYVTVGENDMDAITAVSGSGLAYIYSFADSLIKAGVECGLKENISKECVLQTITGAVEMLKTSEIPIEDMINAVCSKGGTTIEAINVLNDNNFLGIISKAVKAAYEKSIKLSKNL